MFLFNFLSNIKNYSEMRERISSYTFLFNIFFLYYISNKIPSIKHFFNNNEFTIKIFENEFSILLIGIAFAITNFAKLVNLHDKISDFFKIRLFFDVNFVLVEMAKHLNISINDKFKKKLTLNRKDLMSDVFYQYASSGNNSKIDSHIISMALNQWALFWRSLMHYKLNNQIIKSENAAKSMKQPSNYLINLIKSKEKIKKGLDFGCGKLRYFHPMLSVCKTLTLVDSEIQLNRIQKIGDQTTTIPNYIKSYSENVSSVSFKDFSKQKTTYNFILCANVLSTIPLVEERKKILYLIHNALEPDGECLFVTQYTNSYFTKISKSEKSVPHLDGYLVNSRNGFSYFGIINRKKLMNIVEEAKFSIIKSWNKDQSSYLMAGK